jgi:hypothetical protein
MSRKHWPDRRGYSLNVIADLLNIQFQHHHAMDDSLVCAQIALNILKSNQVNSINELPSILGFSYGSFFPGGYKPARQSTRACSRKVSSNKAEALYDVKTLMKNKTPYIGNNSKVAAIINALPLPEGVTRKSIQLSTSQIPYGVTIEYTLNDDSMRIGEEQFLRNSVLLFALIDNADLVTHIGYWNAKELSSLPFRFSYTRADAEKVVGGDLRQFADNHEKLAELIQVIQFLKEDKKRISTDGSSTDISIDHFEYPSTWPKFEILHDDKQLLWVRGDPNFTGKPGGVIGNTMFGMNEGHVDKMISNSVEPGSVISWCLAPRYTSAPPQRIAL